ncbi:MAG: calcium-binding protein, partial [Paracoccaceae bacterium]
CAARWNTLYQQTTVYSGDLGDVEWFEHQFEAAFVYARIDRPGVNVAIRDTGIADFAREADFLATFGNRGAFGSTINPYAPYGWGSSVHSAEEAADIFLRMHALTGDARWLTEAVSDMQALLGANPLNMTFLTGLGGREPERILNVDAETLGVGAPPGITIYGDNNIFDQGYDWFHGVMQNDVWPNFYQTPVAESFQGFENFVAAAEYTVMQGMQDTMFVTGYLAAQQLADALRGTDGDERMFGTRGDDLMLGEAGADGLLGQAGDDRMGGGAGDDRLRGMAGDDTLFGEAGNDRLVGQDGDDVLSGGSGADMLMAGAGADVLIGGDDADQLYAAEGDDTLLGSAGADRLFGEAGDDILGGEAGNDTLRGGEGEDAFIFLKGGGADLIADFAVGDQLWIDTLPDVTVAALLQDGTFSADRLRFTLDLGDGDVLTIQSATAITRPMLVAAIDLI